QIEAQLFHLAVGAGNIDDHGARADVVETHESVIEGIAGTFQARLDNMVRPAGPVELHADYGFRGVSRRIGHAIHRLLSPGVHGPLVAPVVLAASLEQYDRPAGQVVGQGALAVYADLERPRDQ